MTPRRRLLLTAAGLVALACSAPAGAGAAGWVTGPPVSAAGGVAVTPMAAVSPSGERFVAWERVTPDRFDHVGLAVRVAQPGGDFGDVQLINDAGESDASLTVGSDGTAALVWFSGTSLHIATRRPGRPTFAEASPFPLGGSDFAAPKVAMAGGDIYVTVGTRTSQNNVTTTSINALRLMAGGSAIERLAGTGPGGVLAQATYTSPAQPDHIVGEPDIAVAGGELHVLWEDMQNAPIGGTGVTKLMRAAGTVSAGTLGAPTTVDTVPEPAFFRAPELSPLIGAGGGRVELAYETPAATIAFQDLTGGGGLQTVMTDRGFNLRGGVDARGSLVLAFERSSGADSVDGVYVVTIPAGGPAGPILRLTPPNANRQLDDVALGPDGSALVLPSRVAGSSNGGNNAVQLQAAFRPGGGAFGALEEVSGPGDRTGSSSEIAFERAAGAIGMDGRTIVAWGANDRSGERNERIFVSERDGTPPALAGVSVPASAATGDVVGMSATATDALTASTVTWDFGDGTGTTGPSVATAYTDPGTYTVTVTARDAFGNSTSLTRTIVVASPPSPPGGGSGGESDRTPPLVTGLKGKNARFRASSAATADIAAKSKKKAPVGTVFSLRLDERATLVFAVSGKVAGRKTGTRCIAGAKKGRACRLAVNRPVFIRTARGPGTVAIPFSGSIAGTRLAAGSYTATVTAIDAAGNRSRPATVPFTVVSR